MNMIFFPLINALTGGSREHGPTAQRPAGEARPGNIEAAMNPFSMMFSRR